MFKKGYVPWNKGMKMSEEFCKKISEKLKGRTCSIEHRINNSIARRGKKFSEESKRKMSRAKVGRFIGNKNPFFGKKHSEETKRKMSEIKKKEYQNGKVSPFKKIWQENPDWLRGEKGSNWKGGITSIIAKIRNSLEMKLWREAVFARDNFTCQKTGISGGRLIAHHINNFSDFPELRTSIENGITLSKKSHIEFHKKYGRKNNTRKQLQQFFAERG